MDSGNSGSYQSSSAGDEEYNSRAADSLFMTTHDPPPPPRPLFDPLSNYSLLLNNPNMYWPGTTPIRSDPNPSASHDPMLPTPSFPTPTPVEDNRHLGAAQNLNQTAARNPKKRSRASRRAPTTVLTTDTTNFRAMVQEFTGIPPQPFNNSSFSRSRLDLFATRSAAAAPPYLRRPFPQKVPSPPPPFLSSASLLSSTAIDAMAAASFTANNNVISSVSPLAITQSSNHFNVNQNQFLTSLLQSNPKFLFSNSSVMASRPHSQSFDHEFGLSDGNHTLSGLPNLISPDQIAAQNDAERWKNSNNGGNPDEDDEYEAQMKRINGGYSHSNGEKVPENIGRRGEGMVESWICSSD